jgi:quercetin dioxygenase-like cupin family protein
MAKERTVDVKRAADATYEHGDEGRFTGEVWLRSGPAGPDGTNVGVVQFSPGARTRWHRHPGGQFLYGVSGRGRVRSRDDAGHVLLPGDVVFVVADEWHFHGAAPESPLTHVAVNGGGAPEWGDPVTDAEYAEGF